MRAHETDHEIFADSTHDIGIVAQILADLGLTTIRILTTEPEHTPDPRNIEGFGLAIVERIPLSGRDPVAAPWQALEVADGG